MSGFAAGTLVQWSEEGVIHYGVAINEIPMCDVCADWETPVHPISKSIPMVYMGMPTRDLALAKDTPPELLLTADHIRNVCKIGCGEKCCKFLTVGEKGAECAKGQAVGVLWDIEFKDDLKSKGDNCLGKMGSVTNW